jgi:hypothetical protein
MTNRIDYNKDDLERLTFDRAHKMSSNRPVFCASRGVVFDVIQFIDDELKDIVKKRDKELNPIIRSELFGRETAYRNIQRETYKSCRFWS